MHDTPAKPNKLLHRDEEAGHRTYQWSHHSVMGMLNYLSGTHLDLLFLVHQSFRFCSHPKLSHEKAVKRIICYLKQAPNEGIVLGPDSSCGIQSYVDADFAGNWSSSETDDPFSVYSHTGYVIMFAGCPIV